MRKIISIFLIISQVSLSYSQQENTSPLAFSVSYYGDLGIHPGIKLGGNYYFTSFEKSKKRKFKKVQEKKGNKLKYKTYYSLLSLGGYSHPNNHNGWFGNIGAGYERVNARQGRLFGYSLSVGYLYRDYKFDTYELFENEIETIRFAGSGGVLFSLAPHFGRDLSIKTSVPLKIQLKPVFQLMQYNHSFAPNAAIELELVYHL